MRNKINWQSPYQQEKYNQVLAKLGIPTRQIEIGGKRIYLNKLTTPEYNAWELGVDTNFALPKEGVYWRLLGLTKYSKINWSDDNYYTLVVDNQEGDVNYTPSNRRAINKAMRSNLRHSLIDPDNGKFDECLEIFRDRAETRDDIEFPLFIDLVRETTSCGVADLHAIIDGNRIASCAVVLKSPTIVNIRFLNSNNELLPKRPVNYLYHSIIGHCAKDSTIQYVDLSGIVGPNCKDEKLVSINRFKRGFSDLTVEFQAVNSTIT